MKKVNVPRVIWVVCLFLVLIVILFMVMDYKINYQYLSHEYLYFYECDDNLCVSNVKDDTKLLFSAYDCEYSKCPVYKKMIGDDYALLFKDDKYFLYEYRKNMVISREYEDYEFIDGNYIIVLKNGVYGIIDINDKVIVSPVYDEIGIHTSGYLTGYGSKSIIAKKNDFYGLISYKDGKMILEFQYTNDNLDELISQIKSEE